MRKFLLSAVALTGLAVTAQFAGVAPAQAQPYGYGPGYGRGYGHGYGTPGALVGPTQYHQDWRWRERERRHEEWLRRQRHQEWRRHHGYYGH